MGSSTLEKVRVLSNLLSVAVLMYSGSAENSAPPTCLTSASGCRLPESWL